MTFLGRWTLLLIALAARVEAQPGIRQNGVFNSASHIPPTLSGGALAPGARFTMLGVRFGSSPGTTIMLSSAGFAIPVQTIEVTAGRIEALLPRSTPPGSAKLVVTTDGKASKPFSVTIAPSNPGIYSRNGEVGGQGESTISPPQAPVLPTRTRIQPIRAK